MKAKQYGDKAINSLQLMVAIACFILACSVPVRAADIQAFVDRTNTTPGESVHLTVSIKGAGGDVDVSAIRDFKVISRGTSTNYEIVNGRTSWKIVYNYTLIPLKTGRLIIPPLSVESDGKIHRTREIVIQVSKRGQAQERDVFVDARISNPSPYEGQQIIYTFKFYHAVQVARGVNFQKPEFSGFTAKNIESERSYSAVISGRQYNITELRYVLVPLNPGEKIIDPAVLECNVVRSKRNRHRSAFDSFLDDSFFGRGDLDPRILRTEQLKVNVKPLPAYNGEIKFSGLVGKFGIQAELEADTLKVGDSTTLSITINGTGNIMDAEEPEVNVPEAFKVYKDNPEETVKLGTAGYTGKKIFRIALVPIREGHYVFEPIQFSYFDVSKGRYETRSTKALSLMVSPSDEKDTLEVFSAPDMPEKSLKKKVEFTGRDILPLKEGLDALENQKSLSLTGFILFLMIPGLSYLGVRAAFVFTQKSDDPAHIMAQRAENALKDACAIETSEEEFFSCLYKAVISVILSKAGIKGESLTYTEAEKILRTNGYSEEIAKNAANLLEKIESAQYSGLNRDKAFRENLLSETEQMVKELS
ncbi:Aerotolerance-related protein domain-containing protein [Desulfonema magnum]|uniref:Aerotolerance-related protein domain-containing protein n=1 Tax=Desulfonema magnum TaxID=45655 RepID=A0A975BQP6_9BACT|nr:Aerotolerance-related protein domain-containing protein [Desulfonema magnum]